MFLIVDFHKIINADGRYVGFFLEALAISNARIKLLLIQKKQQFLQHPNRELKLIEVKVDSAVIPVSTMLDSLYNKYQSSRNFRDLSPLKHCTEILVNSCLKKKNNNIL
jgi:hypothetical protein